MKKTIKNGLFSGLSLALAFSASGSVCPEAAAVVAQEQEPKAAKVEIDTSALDLGSASVEEIRAYILQSFSSATNSLIKISAKFSEDEELKELSQTIVKAIKGFMFLNDQVSPFDSSNQDKLAHPKCWMSLEDLYEQLGAKEKKAYEQHMDKVIQVVELILVKSKNFVEMVDRFCLYNQKVTETFTEMASTKKYAKFAVSMSSPGDTMSLIQMGIKAKMASDVEFRDKVNTLFDESLQVRQDMLSWIKMVMKGCYSNIHLPTHDSKVALERLADTYGAISALKDDVDGVIAEWSKA